MMVSRNTITIGLDVFGTLGQTGATGGVVATNDQLYLYDGNGNVVASTMDGNIIDKIGYTPFGEQTAGEKLPFTHSTKFIDESGMYYYGYRFYDNMSGKWLSRDLLSEQGGMNLYAFANNVAVNAIDAYGAIPVATTVGNLIWNGTEWLIETTVAAGVTAGNATWDGVKWVKDTTVGAFDTGTGMIWDGLTWLGDGIVAVGYTCGNAIWNGAKWVTQVVVNAGVTAGNAIWDGTRWVKDTTVASGVWIGAEMWDGAKWVWANALKISGEKCGSKEWQQILVPDAPLSFDFSECCDKHDTCYETPCKKKSVCDSQFRNCMIKKSEEITKWYRPGFVGIGTAWVYEFGVNVMGCDAYKTAQKEHGNTNPTCD